MSRARAIPLLAATLALALPAGALAASAKRFGAEALLLDYDAERSVFKVKVTSPKVSGGYGSGGIAGKPAPGIESGDELELAVVPEGSVLRRTVIKASKGGGLDNSGTREGFARAVAAIPRDRPVVLSFEKNGAGEPEYVLRMVQIRMTPEEVAQRLRELGLDEDADAVERGE